MNRNELIAEIIQLLPRRIDTKKNMRFYEDKTIEQLQYIYDVLIDGIFEKVDCD